MTLLTDIPPELAAAGWELEPGGKAIVKTFRFKGFRDAMAFMMRAAFEAEAANHHPEWSNVYSRVTVRMTTHDAGGLTGKDTALAAKMDRIAG